MEVTKMSFQNPNDLIREQIRYIYYEAKKQAALSNGNMDIPTSFKNLMDKIKENNETLYGKLLQILYLDYIVSDRDNENEQLVKEEITPDDLIEEDIEDLEETAEEDFSLVESLDDLVLFVDCHAYILSEMVVSTDVREIDIAHTYRCMHKLSLDKKERVNAISPMAIFDYIEMSYPFVLSKTHKNLLKNEFAKESSAKSVSIVDLIHEMREFKENDYESALRFFLELYYRHKKYGIEQFDSLITKRERELVRKLDEEDLLAAMQMIKEDDDLLETVINEYSANYFEPTKLVSEVASYYQNRKRREKLDLIFRKGKEI